MTPTSDDSLRFSCPQCQAPLKVSAALAGKRRRCPRCQLVLEVPRKSRSTAQGADYPLSQQTGPSAAEQPAYIPVNCPVCHTRVYTTIELVGQKLVCPDCGTPTVVPPPAPAAKPVAAPAGAEGYPLCEEASTAPRDDGAAEEATIRLTCVRCGTMMYAAEDQIGREIVCPDCDLPTIVRQPAEGPPKKAPRSASESGEYAAAGETDRTAGGPEAAKPTYVATLCPVCHTRLHATLDQVGGKLTCPDCGTATVIPPPPPPPRKADVAAEIGAGYGVTGWGELGPQVAAPQRRPPPPAVEKPRAPTLTERSLEPSVRPTLPSWPFLIGTFTFPVSHSARAVAFVLAAWAMLCVALAEEAFHNAAIATGPTLIGSMLMGACALVLTVMWFVLASACGLAVVRDTAAGCDEIQNWPDLAFVDWILEPLYVFNSVCVGLLPGIGLAWWTGRSLQLDETAAIGVFVLFPIVLLSMLERSSPFGAVSLSVYRTFWMAWRGWLAFYLSTAALLSAAAALVMMVFADAGIWGSVAATVTVAAVWLIYFRLLGRLAWYCTEHTFHEEPETERDAAAGRDSGRATTHGLGP